MISNMMRVVFSGTYKREERESAAGRQRQLSGDLNSGTLEIVIPGQVFDEASGVGRSASGLSTTGITCRKGKEREDEEEMEREAPFVTHVKA